MRAERISNAHDSIFGSVGHKILAKVLQWLDGSARELVTPTDLKPTGGFGHVRQLRAVYQFAQCHCQLPPGWKRPYSAFNLVARHCRRAPRHNKHSTTLPTMR